MRTQKKPKKLQAEELFQYAVKCLGVRAWSTADLAGRLRLRSANPADVDEAIARLKDIGYLDDQRFAENFAISRVQNEGFGRARILSDLRARRVSGELAEQAVRNALDGKNEAELIHAWIERRMPSIASSGGIDDERKLAAAYRRLRRAGFSSGPVLTALKTLAARPDVLEDPPEDDSEDQL